jgi:hypothetical protein
MKKLFTLLMSVFAFAITASAQDTYVIVGDYNGWNLTDNVITFTEEDGGYVAEAAEFKTGQYGFKIIKNPAVTEWTYQYGIGEAIATGTDNTLKWIESGEGGNIHIGFTGNDVTLHNVKFEFFPGSEGTLDYFRVTADEQINISEPVPTADKYIMVGTFQGWSFENNPLVFEYQGDNVYVASIDEIYSDWKIVRNNSWDSAFGGAGMNLEPGNTYNLVKGGDNTGFAQGVVLHNATFTLTVIDDENITLKVEGSTTEEHTYGVVGGFEGWNVANATLMTDQGDGLWTVDIDEFPGGEEFKISIDKSWDCFLAPDAPTQLNFGEPFVCVRGDSNNNLSIGEKGTNYDVHIELTIAADRQSAELVITDVANGIELLRTGTKTVDAIYNVAGQRMSAPAKGLNIINGKKIVIR